MLKKTLAAVFLIASGPLSANELADLVNSSQAIRDTFKEGIKAVGGMWEYHSVGGIAQTGVVDPGMISAAKAQAYNNAVLAFKDATYTWSPDADSYMEDQAAQASQNLSEAIDDFVQASQAVITVVEVNEMAEEAEQAPDARESIALQEYMDQNDVLLTEDSVDAYNDSLEAVEVAAQTAAAYMAVVNDEGLMTEANDAAYAMNVTYAESTKSYFDASTGTMTIEWADQQLAVNLALNDYFKSDIDVLTTGETSFFHQSGPTGPCWFLEGEEREACLYGS